MKMLQAIIFAVLTIGSMASERCTDDQIQKYFTFSANYHRIVQAVYPAAGSSSLLIKVQVQFVNESSLNSTDGCDVVHGKVGASENYTWSMACLYVSGGHISLDLMRVFSLGTIWPERRQEDLCIRLPQKCHRDLEKEEKMTYFLSKLQSVAVRPTAPDPRMNTVKCITRGHGKATFIGIKSCLGGVCWGILVAAFIFSILASWLLMMYWKKQLKEAPRRNDQPLDNNGRGCCIRLQRTGARVRSQESTVKIALERAGLATNAAKLAVETLMDSEVTKKTNALNTAANEAAKAANEVNGSRNRYVKAAEAASKLNGAAAAVKVAAKGAEEISKGVEAMMETAQALTTAANEAAEAANEEKGSRNRYVKAAEAASKSNGAAAAVKVAAKGVEEISKEVEAMMETAKALTTAANEAAEAANEENGSVNEAPEAASTLNAVAEEVEAAAKGVEGISKGVEAIRRKVKLAKIAVVVAKEAAAIAERDAKKETAKAAEVATIEATVFLLWLFSVASLVSTVVEFAGYYDGDECVILYLCITFIFLIVSGCIIWACEHLSGYYFIVCPSVFIVIHHFLWVFLGMITEPFWGLPILLAISSASYSLHYLTWTLRKVHPEEVKCETNGPLCNVETALFCLSFLSLCLFLFNVTLVGQALFSDNFIAVIVQSMLSFIITLWLRQVSQAETGLQS